jgi:glycosyltransferase involved in cell wall biosynthesis
MKLSILVPTLNEPESIKYLQRLKSILNPQIAKYSGQVEMYIHDAGRSMPTGQKRNEMIANTDGEYIVQIDCDDIVPNYYVSELMTGIESSPDVVSFIGFMTTDNAHRKDFVIKLGERYEERRGIYYRHPNHLTCLKRSAVEKIKFRPIWVMEDYYYAVDLKQKGVLKTEVHISDKWMYHYCFVSNKKNYGRK